MELLCHPYPHASSLFHFILFSAPSLVETGSLHSLVCPGVHYEDQADLHLSAGIQGEHRYVQLPFVPYCWELWVLRIAQCHLLCTFSVLKSFCPALQDSLSYAAETGPLLHRASLAFPFTVSSPTDSWASYQLPFLCVFVAYVCSLLEGIPSWFLLQRQVDCLSVSLRAFRIVYVNKNSLSKRGKWSQF